MISQRSTACFGHCVGGHLAFGRDIIARLSKDNYFIVDGMKILKCSYYINQFMLPFSKG